MVLFGFGVTMVYSASSVEALKEGNPSTYYLFRQALFAAVGGIILMHHDQEMVPLASIDGRCAAHRHRCVLRAAHLRRFFGQGAGGATVAG